MPVETKRLVCPKCRGEATQVSVRGPLGHRVRGQRRNVCKSERCGYASMPFTLRAERRLEGADRRAEVAKYGPNIPLPPASGRWQPDMAVPVGDR